MTNIQKKVYMCKLSENTELNTKEKWNNKFALNHFQDNLVSFNIETSTYSLVTNITAELEQENASGNIKNEYFVLVVDEIGTTRIHDRDLNYVLGHFAKSTRYLDSMINLENGQITDQNLRLKESGTTPSHFLYFVEDRILYYEYNKNGVSFFDGRFYRYLDTIYGHDLITITPIIETEAMRQAIQRCLMKRLTLTVAASDVGFVNKLIGLPVNKRFASSLGDENYNITIIISSNRKSRLGERFVTAVWNSFSSFRRKDDIKKLEFLSENDDHLSLIKDLRDKLETSFRTCSLRSKRIEKDDFKNKIISHYRDNEGQLNRLQQ